MHKIPKLSVEPKMHLTPPVVSGGNSSERSAPIEASRVGGPDGRPTMPQKIVFVCFGNIIRSKAAEEFATAFRVKYPSLSSVEFDSAGVSPASANGEFADERMVGILAGRGLTVTGVSRRVGPQDFSPDVHLVFMTQALVERAAEIVGRNPINYTLFSRYCPEAGIGDVPDPYHEPRRFDEVIDLIEVGVCSLVDLLSETSRDNI